MYLCPGSYDQRNLTPLGGPCKPLNKYSVLDSGVSVKTLPQSLHSIHILQKRAIRIISKSKRLSHHIPLCYDLQLLDLIDLCKIKALSFFDDYSIIIFLLLSQISLISTIEKSNHPMIKSKIYRTELAARSFSHSLPNIWNPLDITLKDYIYKSKSCFISKCKAHYISTYENWQCPTINCYVCY